MVNDNSTKQKTSSQRDRREDLRKIVLDQRGHLPRPRPRRELLLQTPPPRTPPPPPAPPGEELDDGGVGQPSDDDAEALDDEPRREDARARGGEGEGDDVGEGLLGQGLEGEGRPVDEEVKDEATEEDHGPVADVPADGGHEGVEVEEVVQGLQLGLGLPRRDVEEEEIDGGWKWMEFISLLLL